MRIHEIIAESARAQRVQLSESQLNEIASIFGNELTEEQLNEIAGGNFLKKLVAAAAIAGATMLASGAVQAHGDHDPTAHEAVKVQQAGQVIKATKNDSARFEQIAAKLNQHRTVSNKYTIKVSNQGGPAEARVFKNDPGQVAGVGPNARYVPGMPSLVCEIHVNAKYFQNLSDDAVAWVIGHEMGHCELKHGDPMAKNSLIKTTSGNWDKEYDADLLGAKLAKAAGFNPDAAYKEMTMLKQHNAEGKHSHTHPDYDARMANLRGEKRQQVLPIKADPNYQAPTGMKQNANGSFTIGESRIRKV